MQGAGGSKAIWAIPIWKQHISKRGFPDLVNNLLLVIVVFFATCIGYFVDNTIFLGVFHHLGRVLPHILAHLIKVPHVNYRVSCSL